MPVPFGRFKPVSFHYLYRAIVSKFAGLVIPGLTQQTIAMCGMTLRQPFGKHVKSFLKEARSAGKQLYQTAWNYSPSWLLF
jgi:hypothetical protein